MIRPQTRVRTVAIVSRGDPRPTDSRTATKKSDSMAAKPIPSSTLSSSSSASAAEPVNRTFTPAAPS